MSFLGLFADYILATISVFVGFMCGWASRGGRDEISYAINDECPFCRIIHHNAPVHKVKEWDDAIAIVPLNPVIKGHVLVIPKAHVADALADGEISSRVMKRAVEYARSLNISVNLITSVGSDATQTVYHLHIHIIPRYKDDGLKLPWSHS